MYQLSDASKVRRATIYGWMQGKAIPKADKLIPVLKHLNCPDDQKKELMDLCMKARDANPRPKGYKNRSLWEKDGTERLKFLFDKYGIDLLNASSLDYDLKIRPKVLRGRTKPVPVFFKNKTADLNAIFVKGCEVRMKAGSDFVLIIIFDNNPNLNRTLFEYYGIIMVSERDLFEYTQSILSGLFPNN
jgi:transcriptional regulator with XRE-family HTH domain